MRKLMSYTKRQLIGMLRHEQTNTLKKINEALSHEKLRQAAEAETERVRAQWIKKGGEAADLLAGARGRIDVLEHDNRELDRGLCEAKRNTATLTAERESDRTWIDQRDKEITNLKRKTVGLREIIKALERLHEAYKGGEL